jgi:hypothetical protein
MGRVHATYMSLQCVVRGKIIPTLHAGEGEGNLLVLILLAHIALEVQLGTLPESNNGVWY